MHCKVLIKKFLKTQIKIIKKKQKLSFATQKKIIKKKTKVIAVQTQQFNLFYVKLNRYYSKNG